MNNKENVASKIAVGIASVDPTNYDKLVDEISRVLDRFGIEHLQRPKGEKMEGDWIFGSSDRQLSAETEQLLRTAQECKQQEMMR